MKKINKKKGFTIVELVIVIAVIAILAAVLIPTFSGVVDKANESKALQEVKNAYTVYLADQLTSNQTADNTIFVNVSGTYVQVDAGEVKVVTAAADGYEEYEIFTKANGEKSLQIKSN